MTDFKAFVKCFRMQTMDDENNDDNDFLMMMMMLMKTEKQLPLLKLWVR